MSQRKKTSERCPRCLMRQELCLCASIPQLHIATRLIIVMSKRELKVPTNTGRLAAQALPNSVILLRGDQNKPYNINDHLLPDRPSLLLYPADDAAILSREYLADLKSPVNLIVPDGNWRQTSKMRKRDEHLALMPLVKLPPGPPTQYRVRKETKAEGLATIEAIARCLGILEGAEIQEALEVLLGIMVNRTLSSRGVPLS